MNKLFSFAAVAALCGTVAFFSCTKSESTKTYTCTCTIVQSMGGTPVDTVTQSYTVNTTPSNAQSACNSSISQTSGSFSQTGTCTYK